MHKWVLGGVLVTALLAGCATEGGGSPPVAGPSGTAGAPAGSPAATSAAPAPPGSGTEAPPPADATLVIFLPLGTTGGGDGQVEITEPASIDTLAIPAGLLDRVRAAVRPFQRRGLRLFAFTRGGCRNTGAVLSVNRGGMLVMLTGGEETRCFAAEYFLAVFAVPTGKVPPGTRP